MWSLLLCSRVESLLNQEQEVSGEKKNFEACSVVIGDFEACPVAAIHNS